MCLLKWKSYLQHTSELWRRRKRHMAHKRIMMGWSISDLSQTFLYGAIHKWCHPLSGGGGSAKRWCYSISLFSKMDDEGGRGQKFQKMGDVIYVLYPVVVVFFNWSDFWKNSSREDHQRSLQRKVPSLGCSWFWFLTPYY